MDQKVTFEEDNFQKEQGYAEERVPTIIYWTIKYSGGLIKGRSQATIFLVILAIIFLAMSAFLFFSEDDSKGQDGYLPSEYRVINNAGEPPGLNKPYFAQ